MTVPVTSRTRQRSKTRARLVEAASRLFAERGYAGSSVAAIGEAAGVSRGLVNFHFGTKEELLGAVIETSIAEWEEEVLESSGPGLSGFERVRAIFEAHRRFLVERPSRARLIYRLIYEALDDRRGLAPHFVAMNERWRARTLPWWQEAVRDGLADPAVDHGAVTALLLGALRGIALDYLVTGDAFDLDGVYEQLWRSFTRGVMPFPHS